MSQEYVFILIFKVTCIMCIFLSIIKVKQIDVRHVYGSIGKYCIESFEEMNCSECIFILNSNYTGYLHQVKHKDCLSFFLANVTLQG